MIFITVGTQLPFNRLIQAVDLWAKEHPEASIFGQIGKGTFTPNFFKYKTELSPVEYERCVNNCNLIVSHAGIGTILSAMNLKKRIIVFPRRADLNEHRNNHQMATARWLENLKGIYIAQNSETLIGLLNKHEKLQLPEAISQYASGKLINTIRSFLLHG